MFCLLPLLFEFLVRVILVFQRICFHYMSESVAKIGYKFSMNNYLKLIELTTPYASRMTRLRNRIFGDILTPRDEKSKRIVRLFKEKPVYKTEEIVNYYPRHTETVKLISVLRDYGLFRDEHLDFKEEMNRLRRVRGKVKPAKGSGKQAINK